MDQRACEDCLARAWLLTALAARLEPVRARIEALLVLPDDELIAAVGGEKDLLRRFDPDAARERAATAGLATICRCHSAYPASLCALDEPPAVLHVAGELGRFERIAGPDAVAIVGARRASPYGLEMARSLGRGVAAAGLTIVSGMALGVDSSAHAGALDAGGATVAVLPAGADRPYPAAKRQQHRLIRARGAAISELPPGSDVWRWMFPARNRVIAALAAMTVVVEAGERSGALLTAEAAGGLGRIVGAVPGRVTSPMASGPNALLAAGARVIRGPQDVLDALCGHAVKTVPAEPRAPLEPGLRRLLETIAGGSDTPAALSAAGFVGADALAALASLELAGYVRRQAGGRFTVVP